MSSVPTVATGNPATKPAPAKVLPAKPTGAGEQELAAEVHVLVMAGRWNDARDRYGDLVGVHQRRASRLAYYYLRDAAEADEAVQDAFVKAFSHFASYDRTRPFEIWFTRILVNACLDRVKARKRRLRWQVGLGEHADDRFSADQGPSGSTSPEEALLQQERAHRLMDAIRELPNRQRTVVVLSHLDGRTTREVSEATGLSESTVRVHLFRGLRRLRSLMSHR
jgi:RNA polymerase sigma-70 factor, ECF subfamily